MKLNKILFNLEKYLFIYFITFPLSIFCEDQTLTGIQQNFLSTFNIEEGITNQELRFKLRKSRNFIKKLLKKDKIEIKTAESPGAVLEIGEYHLNHFELQFSREKDSGYITISQEEIANGFEENPYFVTVPYDTHNAVQFSVKVNAPTTSGSSYPRSELRQVNPDGTKASFNAFEGNYSLAGTTRITHLPPVKPEVVVAQLFDGDRDRVAIRTQVINKTITLVVRINGRTVKPYLASPYVLGDEFEWKILVENGLASVFYNDMSKPIIDSQMLDSKSTSWYFKTGCYSQTNSSIETDPNEYVSTELRNLRSD